MDRGLYGDDAGLLSLLRGADVLLDDLHTLDDQTVVGQHAGDGALLAAILAADDLDQVAALDLGYHVRSPPERGTRCA